MPERRDIYYDDGELARRLLIDEDGTVTGHTAQDCEALVENNKLLRDFRADARAKGAKEEFRLMARVPAIVWERAVREGWAFDDAAWRRWMNDPDNRAFRVNEGAV